MRKPGFYIQALMRQTVLPRPAAIAPEADDILARIFERVSSPAKDAPSIEALIAQVHQDILHQRIDGTHWNFHAHLGSHFISQYFLFSEWCRYPHSKLDKIRLADMIIKAQLPDGSWIQVADANMTTGDLNTSIFNYWGLKALGISTDLEFMQKARAFILKNGGLEQSALFTKIIMALFNNYNWNQIAYTPYLLFMDKMPSNYQEFSQWVIPHLMAISYLRCNRVSKNLGPQFNIEELFVEPQDSKDFPKAKVPNILFDSPLVEKILAHQQPHGSWGGYTLSTLLSNVVLLHYEETMKDKGPRLSQAVEKGFSFVEKLYFTEGPGAYKGALMDGKNWDTILIGNSLVESGLDPKLIQSSFDFVVNLQTKEGGIPYGEDFEYAPDTDDTAEAVLFLSHQPERYRAEIARAVRWICKMQNRDGGWGAFDLNNCGNPILRTLTKGFQDSVDLFDDSSADITGHVLECLAKSGFTIENSETVQRAVSYLKETQDLKTGTWIGRWGVNYIFGTICTLTGLLRVGEDPKQPYIRKALNWLLSKQNADGGFGESVDSYKDPKHAGVGVSTPTQTAWVLSTLVAAGLYRTPQAQRAVKYLIREHNEKGTWVDTCVVGTGHPGLLYMNYPSYALAFPLLALSQYLDAVKAEIIDDEILPENHSAIGHNFIVLRDKKKNSTHAGG